MSDQLVKPGRPTIELKPGLPDYPTIVHALAYAAESAPDRPAVICENQELSYLQLSHAVGGLARQLGNLGAAGGRIALFMGNGIETSVAGLGGMAARGQIAPFNPAYTDNEVIPLMRDCNPLVIVCNTQFEERAQALATKLDIPHVMVLGTGEQTIEEWSNNSAMTLPETMPQTGDKAAMFFTGGTTGIPKGAEHDHAMMSAFCRSTESLWSLDFDCERILSVAPMFHIWGHHFTNVMPIYLRATLVIVPKYKPELVLEQFERHSITVFAGGPPAIYMGLMGVPSIAQTDFSALKYCLSGGAACPGDLLRAWEEKTGCALLEGGGMSEGAPIACNPTEGMRKPTSIGITPPLTKLDIVDIETGTQVLNINERGELRAKGPQFTRSYRNQPEETENAVRDGWLYTGDIGYFDEDGFLFLVDRKKELIMVGGFNVYPREVDEVLHSHPAVHEAAAVGIPDDFLGEVVKACVSLKPGQKLNQDDLISYCGQQLVDYKVPKVVEILEELPKTGSAKIDKLKLRGLR